MFFVGALLNAASLVVVSVLGPTAVASQHLEARTLTAGWSLKANCLSDSASSRLLSKGFLNWSNLTLAICVSTCDKAGYIYAGPEYGNQCWCGNALNTTGGSGKAVGGCTMVCAGSGNGTCGGGNAIGPIYIKTVTKSEYDHS